MLPQKPLTGSWQKVSGMNGKTVELMLLPVVAGATATPGYINTNPEKTGFPDAESACSRRRWHKNVYRKLGRQPSFITGRGNRLASFIMQKILPRKMAIKIMGDTTRKMYRL